MNKRTKFNIGDKIYIIDCFDKWSIQWMKATVTGVQIICRKNYKYIKYEIDALMYGSYEEQYCFATQAEAQAECDRRNNGK